MKRFLHRSSVKPDAGRDVGDELRFHLEMRTREFMEAGLSPEDAARSAAAAFGDISAIDAQLRDSRVTYRRSRERRERLRELATDVRFALRTLRHNLVFTLAALATLALGIGATTSVFTVTNGVLLRPLPYPDPSRLMMIWLSSKKIGAELPVSAGFFTDLSQAASPVASTAAARSWNYTLAGGDIGETEQLSGARVTPSFFPVMGVRPALGRALAPADAEAGAAPVAVIGYQLWQQRFGGDPAIIGRRIELGGESFNVVGVMPSGFAFPRGAELPPGLQFGPRTELWTPLVFTPQERAAYGTLNLTAIARLRPGKTASALRSAVDARLKQYLVANAPKLDLEYRLADLQQQAGQHVRRGLLLLMAAAALLLFIACANVTNLLLARTAGRGREFSVRAALGAGHGRIARQLITENVILASCGGVMGVVVSAAATRAILSLVPGSLPRADDIAPDWRVATLAVVVTLMLGIIFGLAATRQVQWSRLAGALRESGRSTGGASRRQARRALVGAEVALSVMLVIGASLLTVSFVRLQRTDPGFRAAGAYTANISLPLTGAFEPDRDGARWSRFFSQLVAQLAVAPGVDAVGAVSALPLANAAEGGPTAVVGEPEPQAGQAPQAQYFVVAGDYFRAAGIRVLRGRAFNTTDEADAPPVAIVNREYARKYLHGTSIDRQLITYFDFSKGRSRTIVGVADNVQYGAIDDAPAPQVYVPEAQMPYPGLQLVVRGKGDPSAMLPLLKREVARLDGRLAVAHPRTLAAVVGEATASQRFSMILIGIFAGSALLLAAVGLYGVIALSVGQRRREIGVRMALGARASDVRRLVLGEGLRIAAAGVAVGLIGAYAASRVLTSVLYHVSATNAAVYGAAAVTTIGVTALATYLPARRATRIDPVSTLRAD